MNGSHNRRPSVSECVIECHWVAGRDYSTVASELHSEHRKNKGGESNGGAFARSGVSAMLGTYPRRETNVVCHLLDSDVWQTLVTDILAR